MNLSEAAFPVNGGHLIEIFDAVAAQSGVSLKVEEAEWRPASLNLGTHSVAVLDVGGEVFANVALFSSLHKLVGVIHKVQVYAGIPVLGVIIISRFDVCQAFGRWHRVRSVVCEVVPFRLSVGIRDGGIGMMAIVGKADARFRVDEVVAFVDVELLIVVL